jgi:hypothetical protein
MTFSNHPQLFELSDELRACVEAELNPQEQIVWVEQPIPWLIVRSTLPILLIGIPFTAFALFWIGMATFGVNQAQGAPAPLKAFPLFGLPFVLVGLAMFSAPYWALRGAKRTVYVLTTQRAIILRGGWINMNVRSFDPAALTTLNRKQRPDGSGDLIFAQDFRPTRRGQSMMTNVGFMAVRDVKQVENLVRTLAQQTAHA